jgi:mannose-6-phosphate isomerase-like protein (cupin superfamily)
MKTTIQFIPAALMLAASLVHADDADFKVATIISAERLTAAQAEAPADRVSDQPISHVESAEGRLGVGVVHRPIIEPGGPIAAIQHHKQSEVYRVMAGSGILVTSSTMVNSVAIDPDGNVVRNLTGPSDRGVIENIENSEEIGTGDVIIIPAGVAHGFSEISEPITYMVVRVDPERLVALK